MKRSLVSAAALAVLVFAATAQAGPVIIDGTDANDHGSASATANLSGWLYMQRAFENLGAAVNPLAAKVITVLGTAAGEGEAYNAIASAFGKSALAAGWTIEYKSGVAAITAALDSLSTSTTGILHMTTCSLAGGDLSVAEMTAINSRAAQINNFVGGAGNASLGGALFSMGQSCDGKYGWLSSLIPGITSTDIGGGGVSTNIGLTAAGNTAFPSLTNADLAGADPWHGYFSGNLGGLSVLATAVSGGQPRAVIIGGGAGTVLQCGVPGAPACPTVPEPGSLLLVATAALALRVAATRRGGRRA